MYLHSGAFIIIDDGVELITIYYWIQEPDVYQHVAEQFFYLLW